MREIQLKLFTPFGLHYGVAPVNLARSGTASQSSTLSGGDASRAIDGNRNGDFAQNSVAHTGEDSNAWWQVDLAATNSIGSIRIANRTDCCSTRLKDFYVFVSTEPFTSTDLSTTLNQSGVSAYYINRVADETALLVSRSGRYVRVQLTGTDYLHMAEVMAIEQSASIVDSDSDGLPDNWEMQYFGNLSQNGSSDCEGDGFTNLQEYQNGTNPVAYNGLIVFTPLQQ